MASTGSNVWDDIIEGGSAAIGGIGGFLLGGPVGAVVGATAGYGIASSALQGSNGLPSPTPPPTTPSTGSLDVTEAEEEEDRAMSHGFASTILAGGYSQGATLGSRGGNGMASALMGGLK